MVALLLLAGVSLCAQSIDVAAGGGTAANTGVPGGFWPAFSATRMFSQHVGINGAFSFDSGSYHPWLLGANLVLRLTRKRFTPELLVGYAAVDLSGPGLVVVCVSNQPGLVLPCPQPRLNPNAFHIGGVIRTYLQHHLFLQFGYHFYLGSRLNFTGFTYTKNISRFAVMLGHTWGKA